MTARPTPWGLLLLTALGTAGCVDLGVNSTQPSVWDAQLVPATAYPDLTGQGAAVSDPSGTSVGIEIHGAAAGGEHLWALMLGTCAVPGQQLGVDTNYPVLSVDANGDASGDTHLSAKLVVGRDYHLAVRVSATDSSRVACGDLTAH